MARITKEQKNYGEAMRHLIELYYRLEETDSKDWYSYKIIALMSMVFVKVFPNFWPCFFFQRDKMFRYGLPGDSIKIKRGDIEIFIAIMKTIRTDISSGRVNLFQIEEPIVNKKNLLQTFVPPGLASKKITSDINGLESFKQVTIIPLDYKYEREYKRFPL